MAMLASCPPPSDATLCIFHSLPCSESGSSIRNFPHPLLTGSFWHSQNHALIFWYIQFCCECPFRCPMLALLISLIGLCFEQSHPCVGSRECNCLHWCMQERAATHVSFSLGQDLQWFNPTMKWSHFSCNLKSRTYSFLACIYCGFLLITLALKFYFINCAKYRFDHLISWIWEISYLLKGLLKRD